MIKIIKHLLRQLAWRVLKDDIVVMPRFPYVFETVPMKPRPEVITYINRGDGRFVEAKNDEEYEHLILASHMQYLNNAINKKLLDQND